jgi:adenylyltransferase/sulfurtransferase
VERQARLCGRNAVQLRPSRAGEVDLEGLARRLKRSAQVSCNPYLLRIGAEECDIALFRDGRSIVRGTEDPARARALFSRYVGT